MKRFTWCKLSSFAIEEAFAVETGKHCQCVKTLDVLAPIICNDKWLEKLRLVDPPIYKVNARVCSEHFADTCYVSPVLEGHGPFRRTLKPDAVPTIFSFVSPPKRRKLSEARQAKSQHKDLVEGLLNERDDTAESRDLEPVSVVTTRDVGTQCGKLTTRI